MKTYPLFKVSVNSELALENIKQVFSAGFINEGVQVTELTQALQQRFRTKNLVLTNSGTSALTMALKLAKVQPGDEVITTPMTCVATNTPIVNAGAKIVWADVTSDSGMINPIDVLSKITTKTKAIMVVAWAGTPPQLGPLKHICDQKGIKLILDAAHAFDAQYDNMPIHAHAHMTCYSFQAIKHFTTGDGGALVCLDNDDYEASKAMKWFGLDRDRAKDAKGDWKGQQWDVDILEAGFKFNMNNVAAAIGLSQLSTIDKNVALHKEHAALYNDLFEECETVEPAFIPFLAQSSYWVYTMLINPENSRLNRDELLARLNSEGIMAGVVHVPNDNYTAFKDSKTDLPGVRYFSQYQFSLPCGWWLTDDDIKHIANRVKELTT